MSIVMPLLEVDEAGESIELPLLLPLMHTTNALRVTTLQMMEKNDVGAKEGNIETRSIEEDEAADDARKKNNSARGKAEEKEVSKTPSGSADTLRAATYLVERLLRLVGSSS